MIRRDVDDIFSPKILGARFLEQIAETEAERQSAILVRQVLEDARDKVMEKVRNEQLSSKNSKKREEAESLSEPGVKARRQRQQFFRFNRAA